VSPADLRPRGADLLARALAAGGVRRLFSLSGNQIMPVYDAALDTGLELLHVRHEAAAVHMADAWARITGEVGVALLTAGQGHTNGVAALPTALAAEAPVVLLSGAAPLAQAGRGAFQEMDQAAIAAPLCKASWTAASAADLGADVARALRIAAGGRPGPVHLSLPFDLLEARVAADPGVPEAAAYAPPVTPLDDAAARALLEALAGARRPLIVTGPAQASARGRARAARLAGALGAPVVCMESPRGVGDPALGAFADRLGEADLVVLLGKRPDYTLRFGAAFATDARIALVDPEPAGIERAFASLGAARARVTIATVADTVAAIDALIAAAGASGRAPAASGWRGEVEAAIAYRPAAWREASGADGAVHPAALGRAVQQLLDAARDAVLVCDGGEFGQWAQACVRAPERVINGVAGSIGAAIPFALAARAARPGATVVAMLGDGAFGFHMAELDTALRAGLPVVVVVGNDACWNAEYQIQLRTYGRERAQGCTLLAQRYDLVAAALGAHGERVTRAAELPAALARAAASGRPACVDVTIEGLPAPVVSRATGGDGAHGARS
jgi:acetolactate synthase-1/2/3 large subunit